MNECPGGAAERSACICAHGRLTDGLDQVFPLGGSHSGESVGALRIHAMTAPAGTNLATPAALQLIDNGTHELDPVYVAANSSILRQVSAPDCLVDIVTNSATDYFLRYYHSADVHYGPTACTTSCRGDASRSTASAYPRA